MFRCTYEVANSQGLTDSAVITISIVGPLDALDEHLAESMRVVDVAVAQGDGAAALHVGLFQKQHAPVGHGLFGLDGRHDSEQGRKHP